MRVDNAVGKDCESKGLEATTLWKRTARARDQRRQRCGEANSWQWRGHYAAVLGKLIDGCGMELPGCKMRSGMEGSCPIWVKKH